MFVKVLSEVKMSRSFVGKLRSLLQTQSGESQNSPSISLVTNLRGFSIS